MSSPYEDKPEPGSGDTTPPAGTVSSPSTTPAPPAVVSESGPLAPAGEGTWGNGPGLNVRFAGRSAVGLVREHNEDNLVIANLTTGELAEREVSLNDAVGEGGLLFAVCDGMGGAAAGEVASQMAVDVLLEAMRRGGVPKERDVLARRLVSAVEEAGRRIFDAAQKERSRRGMGTTATAAVLVDKVLFVGEVGDSRAYLLRNNQLKQLTKDQSLVNQLIEAGHLTEAEAEAFEHSNIILQALGTSETVQVDLTFVELRRGDRLMLCSDGLSGLVHADTLRDALAGIDDPSECTAALVRFAEAGGGHDNITVVVTDFDGEALDLPRDTDSFGYLQYPLVPASSAAGTFSEEEVTEATKPLRMSYDALPQYHPPTGPGVDTHPWLWVSAGLAALLIGAWLLAVGGGGGAATALEDAPTEDTTVTPAEPALPSTEPPTAEAKGVPVHVYSDVKDAVLLVNGEAQGPLAMGDEGRSLDLPPGAYRFEAQSHGNIAAVEVVNVRPEAPVDVYLRLPSGANEPTKVDATSSTRAAQPAPAAEPESTQAQGANPDELQQAPGPATLPKLPNKVRKKGAATKTASQSKSKAAPAPREAPVATGPAAARRTKVTGAESSTAAPAPPQAPRAPRSVAPEPGDVGTVQGQATPTTPSAPVARPPTRAVQPPAAPKAPSGAATAPSDSNKAESPIPENPF